MTLPDAVRELDAALRAMTDAQEVWLAAKQAVVAAAESAGLTARAVLVVGRCAWYIDPPGTHGNGSGWSVTHGSAPEAVEENR